jgi:hypothetical protein
MEERKKCKGRKKNKEDGNRVRDLLAKQLHVAKSSLRS